ncbi:MAG: hypothetical protein ACREBS_02785 [Nitrososphaerales archaeon]
MRMFPSREVPRRKSQKYYPNKSQAKSNRRNSATNAAKMRKARGTQWRHGRKSKAQVKRGRRSGASGARSRK